MRGEIKVKSKVAKERSKKTIENNVLNDRYAFCPATIYEMMTVLPLSLCYSIIFNTRL